MGRRFQFNLGFLFMVTLAVAFVAAAIRAARDGEIEDARAQLQLVKNLQADCHVIAVPPRTVHDIDAKVAAAERRLTELRHR